MPDTDAILLGAMRLRLVRWQNDVEMTPPIDIREKLDLLNGIRSIKLYRPHRRPVKWYGGTDGKPIDVLIVRENSEGSFADRLTPHPPGHDFETDPRRITRHGAVRVCREAFKLARSRRGHCTLVDKANVLPSMAVATAP